MKVDCENVLQQRLNQLLGSFMLQNAVKGNSRFDSDQGIGIFGKASIDALYCLADDVDFQFHGAILGEDVDCPCPQEHDLIVEFGYDVFFDEGR